jgi:putative FmdB family regulatory protein
MRAVPTYDYLCRDCGNVTEVIHTMLEDGPGSCEICGGSLRRVLFPTGIIFKGPGFYRNDSRAGGSSDGSGSGTEKAAATKADTTSEVGSTGKGSKSDAGTSGSTSSTSSTSSGDS